MVRLSSFRCSATGLGMVLMVHPSSVQLIHTGAPGHGHRVGSGPHGSSFIKIADMQVLLAMATGYVGLGPHCSSSTRYAHAPGHGHRVGLGWVYVVRPSQDC